MATRQEAASVRYGEWINIGKQLGLAGAELLEFVNSREQHVAEREERERERENRRLEREAEQYDREARLEQERQERNARLRQQQHEREQEALREQADIQRIADERKQAAEERQARLRQQEQERELEILRLRAENGNGQPPQVMQHGGVQSSRPKLPRFDEESDDIDAFLERFERFARSQRWAEDSWAVSLSPLLSGKGLDVYTSMPAEQANDYNELKRAVLRRYQLTEEGFRVRFRETKPKREETVYQYVARIKRYFERWVELSEIDQDFENLKDLLLREQFINMCSADLALFLKERAPGHIDEVTRLAEQYLEAHGGTLSATKPIRNSKPQHQGGNKSNSTNSGTHQDKVKKLCYSCHKEGHFARDCLKNKQSGNTQRNNQQGTGKRTPSPQNWRARNYSQKSGASCATQKIVDECVKDGQLQLANGETLPYAGALCNDRSLEKRLPLCEGIVANKRVEVLRDTGCNSAAVKRDLIDDKQLNGKTSNCVLIDGTIRRFPLATVHVNTPYFTGFLDAMVMDNPIHELVLGNIPGIRQKPDDEWRPKTLASNDEGQSFANCEIEMGAVTTRGQSKRDRKPIKPLIVPERKSDEIDIERLKEEQNNDDSLKKAFAHAKDKSVFGTKRGNGYRYEVQKDVLYRVYSNVRGGSLQETRQIVVPKKFRRRVMELAHESIVGGHMGVKKTTDRITSNFHWPGLDKDVQRFCQSCDICQKTIPKGRVTKVPLGETPLIDAPFERVAVDLIGPITPLSDSGHRYILTVVDYATRYPEAVPLKKIETERVAEALLEVFSRVGFPKEVLSDRGSQFTSDLMKEVARLVSIKQIFTSPYNPKCNGLCEKMNGTLKAMLKKMCQERPGDWDRYIPAVLFAYREVPQATTGFSPFELLYGRTVRGPMQVLKELWTETDTPETQNTYQYVLDLRNKLEDTCQIARESMIEARDIYRHHYDKKSKDRRFEVGQLVTVLLPTAHNKLLLQWKGPYEVIEVINRMDYKINMEGKHKIFHANLLKLYTPRQEDDAEAAGIAILEVSESDGVVDDESLLSLLNTEQEETCRDVNVCSNLTKEQTGEVWQLLKEFQDIFTDVPGRTDLVEHKVELTTSIPIHVKPYPMPYAKRKDVNKEIEKMLKLGVIEHSKSPYNSPIVMVKKKDGSNRFCIDFRRLNAITKFDSEPMGDTEVIMSKLCKDKYFTKIDLSKGYWQIPMAESCKEKTAFTTPDGCYQCCMMPFGMMNSGASFNRMMRKLIKDLDIDNYVDDILCHHERWKQHIETLRETFVRIRAAGLTIRPSKCFIGYSSIDFTGHVVGNGEMHMEDDKLQKIRDATPPQTKKQVRSFLGLAGYYRKFIPHFAEVASPLTDLTKKGQPNKIIWGPNQAKAFKTLRDLLTSAPILRLPDLSRQFILRTDASDVGVGAVLLQCYEDGIFPVAYASKKLLPREQNYSVIERECLAIVYGVKKFQKYIYGTSFVIQTDHAPLAYLQKAKTESQRLMRWALFLQNYKYCVEAIRGSENVGADFLSRQ